MNFHASLAEIWAPVPGHSRYEVSTRGRMRVAKTGLVLRPDMRWSQHTNMIYITAEKGRRIRVNVARMMLLAHVGPCPFPVDRIRFKDGDFSNVALWNVEWSARRSTPPQNIQRKPRQVVRHAARDPEPAAPVAAVVPVTLPTVGGVHYQYAAGQLITRQA